MTTRWLRLLVALLVLAAWAAPAAAQTAGLRGGLSVDPDQIYFGVHAEGGPFLERFQFRPNVEVGFGNSMTMAALNGEFLYPFTLDNGIELYVGAGPAINVLSFSRRNRNDTTIGPGLNFLLGTSFRRNYFAEIKVGALDSPGVKIGLGYTFSRE